MNQMTLVQVKMVGIKVNAVKHNKTGKIMFYSTDIIECLDFMRIFSIAKDTPTYH